jgi:hypothetical protein
MDFEVSEEEFDKRLMTELADMVINSKVIYKYMGFDIGMKALQHNTLGFTNPLAFNDPYDCTPKLIDFDNLPDKYREYLVTKLRSDLNSAEQDALLKVMYTHPDELVTKKLSAQGMENEIKNRGVTCFSKNFNNILMWSHYAASHTGVCIGFNLEKLYLYISEVSSEKMMVQVTYADTFTPIDYYTRKREAIVQWLKTKAKIWAYEEEIRIIMNHLDFKGDNKYIQSIDKGCFHEVYLGNRIPKENEAAIIQLCNEAFPDMPVYKIIPEERDFKLIGQRIN